MRVVLDANIVAAALVRPHGWTASVLDQHPGSWLVPEFLAAELEEHAAELASKAGCAEDVWRGRVERFLQEVVVIPEEDLIDVMDDPLVAAAERMDPDDAPYVAAYVASEADLIWTRDRRFVKGFPGIAVHVPPTPPDEE